MENRTILNTVAQCTDALCLNKNASIGIQFKKQIKRKK